MVSATPLTDEIRHLLADYEPSPIPPARFGESRFSRPNPFSPHTYSPSYQQYGPQFGGPHHSSPLPQPVFGEHPSPAVYGGHQADLSTSSIPASNLTIPSTPTPAVRARPTYLTPKDDYEEMTDLHEVQTGDDEVAMEETEHRPTSDFGESLDWNDSGAIQLADTDAVPDNIPITEEAVTPEMIEARQEAEEQARIRKEKALDPNGEESVSVNKIHPRYRGLFHFEKFNRVQSKVFEPAYTTDENLVVRAPTSSGKTTIFELALLRLLTEAEEFGSKPLAVYVAPTKALCSERSRDWIKKFADLHKADSTVDIKCLEVTGDTSGVWLGRGGRLDDATLIVTTPEKWDAVTRHGSAGRASLSRLALFMIDEVHILRESRGPTLEVVVSRMKIYSQKIRFVAVSASVPNIDDVARWLGPPPSEEEIETGIYEGGGKDTDKEKEYDYSAKTFKDMPRAKVYKFGEEYRPTKLRRETIGFDGGGNEWSLSATLDRELYPILMKHTEGKPTLVFCPTRRGCQITARNVLKQYKEAKDRGSRLPWLHNPPDKEFELNDKAIQDFAAEGIAVHHAGLDLDDRRKIEEGFKKGQLQLLISTSTLAVGVNLPAHTVIIKGTTTWTGTGNGHREYSDIDIQQMMGRAGRPQFDKSGTVIVMCERSQVSKYRNMLNSTTVLESCLHQNLTEHINSEIALGTVTNLKSAQEWLKSSFLYVRIQQNPKAYAFASDKAKVKDKSWDAWLDHYVEESLTKLEKHKFVTHSKETEEDADGREGLAVTDLGATMSANCISFGTMCTIQAINGNFDFEALFEVLCGALEFNDLRIRPGEGQLLNAIRTSGEMRFKLENPPKSYADKVFILLQVSFGGIDTASYGTVKTEVSSVNLSLAAIYQSAGRIAKAILRVCSQKKLGLTTMAALELSHTVLGRAWETDATIFRQLERIGPKSIKKLDEQAIRSFDDLLRVKDFEIEMWLNRHPPFGKEVLQQVADLPRFTVKIEELAVDTHPEKWPRVTLKVMVALLAPKDKKDKQKRKEAKRGQWNRISALCLRSDGAFVDYRNLPLRGLNSRTNNFLVVVELREPGQQVMLYVGVDEMSGVQTREAFTPSPTSLAFPVVPPVSDDVPEEAAQEATGQDKPTQDPPELTVEPDTTARTNKKTVKFDSTVDSSKATSKSHSSIKNSFRQTPVKTSNPLFLNPDSESEVEEIMPLHLALEQQASKKTKVGSVKRKKQSRSKTSMFIDDEAEEASDSEDELDTEEDEIQEVPKPKGAPKWRAANAGGGKKRPSDEPSSTKGKKPKFRSVASPSPESQPKATTPPPPPQPKVPDLIDLSKKPINDMTDEELERELGRLRGQ